MSGWSIADIQNLGALHLGKYVKRTQSFIHLQLTSRPYVIYYIYIIIYMCDCPQENPPPAILLVSQEMQMKYLNLFKFNHICCIIYMRV